MKFLVLNYFSLCLIYFLKNCEYTDGSNILFYFGLSTYSHRILVWPLVKELADRGHDITFFSPMPSKTPDPRIKDFTPSAVTEFYNGHGVMNVNLLHVRLENRLIEMWNTMPEFSEALCDIILGSEDTKLWANSSHFDLVVIDGILNDCGFAFVHKFQAKHILFSTTSLFMWQYEPFGIVPETSWIPASIYPFPQDMSFYQRLISTVEILRWHFRREWYSFPKLEETIKRELGMNDLPPLAEIEKNTSLILLNSHYSEEYARSLPPLVVSVGGLHITENRNETISSSIKQFIESDDKGFIYICFGSETKISTLPSPTLNAIFTSLEKIGLKVLWKWEGEFPINSPKNIKFIKWAPQSKLLAHPRLRLFIFHGGLLSLHEAIHYAVPVIAIPIFAEQDFNVERVQRMGIGLKLEVRTFDEEEFSSTVLSVLNNPSFKTKAKEISHIFHDRMNSPLETAVWYTEYVLRHNNTNFLKPLSISQSWYKRRLLDVWIFLFCVAVIISVLSIYITFLLMKFIVHKLGDGVLKGKDRMIPRSKVKIQ